MMGPIQPRDHDGHGDLERWDTDGLRTAYKRHLRAIRQGEVDTDNMEQITRKIEVETELASRGVDPRPIVKAVEAELNQRDE